MTRNERTQNVSENPTLTVVAIEGGVFITVSNFSNISRLIIVRDVGQGYESILSTTQTSYLMGSVSITDFGPSGDYASSSDVFHYRACVWNEDGSRSYSETHSISPLSIPTPDLPTNLVTTPGNKYIDFAWTVGENNDYWQIEYKDDVGNQYSVATDEPTYTFHYLTNGVPYSFRVRAQRIEGVQAWTEYTEWVSATPDQNKPSLPEKPRGLVAKSADGKIILLWKNPQDKSVITYEYIYTNLTQGGGSDFSVISKSNAGTTLFEVAGLQSGDKYRVGLRACNRHGDGTIRYIDAIA